MKKISFSKVNFAGSALAPEFFPRLRSESGRFLPEIAIVGRSNVGKSSLINHLTQRKELARVSATPGKTQTLNFFSLDDTLVLVDLPGYGYAKVSGALRKNWAESLDHYFEKRETLAYIFLLLDIRRIPSDEDLAFVRWAEHHQKPLLIIFTKADKLNNAEKKAQMKKMQNLLTSSSLESSLLLYSIKDPQARIALIEAINNIIHRHEEQ